MREEETTTLRAKWDARYRSAADEPREACRVLREFTHLLPTQGLALDLACGLGANALHLARRGLETVAWDLSPVAVEGVVTRAQAAGLNVQGETRDVVTRPPPAEAFDVIVVSYFWEPALCPAIVAALRPDGLLFYQTFVKAAVSTRGPGDPRYRLEANELLRTFGGLRVLVYREEGLVGDTREGLRDEALFVGTRNGVGR